MHPNIRIEIENDYEAMSKKAAKLFAEVMKEHPASAFGFATGSTPIGMYEQLIRMHKEEGLDFSKISSFNLDEYHPIARESDQSYHYFMGEKLFSRVNMDPARVFIPDGKTTDPEAECADYESKINACGGIVMQILGIGQNGHIGFNEPAESFGVSTRLTPLSDITITANARHFDNASDVPRHALTMGIRTIMMAKKIILLANGTAKSEILRDSLLGPITPLVPASALQLHHDVIIVADKEAAAFL